MLLAIRHNERTIFNVMKS